MYLSFLHYNDLQSFLIVHLIVHVIVDQFSKFRDWLILEFTSSNNILMWKAFHIQLFFDTKMSSIFAFCFVFACCYGKLNTCRCLFLQQFLERMNVTPAAVLSTHKHWWVNRIHVYKAVIHSSKYNKVLGFHTIYL